MGLIAITIGDLSVIASARAANPCRMAFSSPSTQPPTSRPRYNPHSANPPRGFAQSGFNEVAPAHALGFRAARPHRTLQIPISVEF
jgi:hypothetical protein